METEKIRVMWFVPPLLAIVARQEEQAMTVEAARNRSSDEQFDALVAGDVDAVVTSMDNVIGWNGREGPRDFRVVAQIERTTPLTLVARPQWRKLSDLRGTNLLVDATGNGFVVALRAMLREAGIETGIAGIEPGAVRLTPAGGVKERFDALMAGQGDATLLGPPFDSMAAASGLTRIASVQDSYPDFPGQGVVVRTGSKANPKVATWLRTLEQARRRVGENAELARQAVLAAGLPAAAAEAMIALNPDSLHPSRVGVALLVAHRRALGLVGADNDYSTIVDDSMIGKCTGEAR
ncbi:ABC transporter substrate-binding protein [Paraburkholderia aspalathi]|uniref:ABC-type nitrate/sulfonate/bicarbonate transport system, substrate-binding protein n=1 Tax=Paraburkholderia aspalathi TaxID=1324617 RepID=A0A1I7BFU1_9BURK|nr:ABC transporter substrate-binding protein [Paraburkholderia aspalathi]SFT85981.1 ABC-type nitrate/sulfonate/bicarbonate transport system, substrate-binding protein [Paraburkholderia aspalathi]